MNRRSPLFRIACLLILAIVAWTALSSVAFAQAAANSKASSGGGGPAYLLPWALIVMCIGLGLLMVCRTSNRKSRAGPQQYERVSFLDREDADKAVATGKRGGLKRTAQLCKEAKMSMNMSFVGLAVVPVAVFALLQGIKARKLISQDRRLTGETQALTGIVVSVLAIVLWLIIGIAVIASALGGSSGSGGGQSAEPPAAAAAAEAGADGS
jgi:hypothetical protein